MKRILICTDGSHYSLEACRFGSALAASNDVEIDVLYVSDIRHFEVPAVADIGGSLGVQPYEGMLAQMHEVERIKSDFIFEQARHIFEKAGQQNRVSYHHETGMLVDIIGTYEERADLVLIGKRGESAKYAAKHLGSMLERIVRASQKPTFVTSRSFKPLRRIALAYDGGASTRNALEFISKNKPFTKLEIHLISVAEEAFESKAYENLTEAKEILWAQNLNPISQVLTGEAAIALKSYVEDASIDALVVGAYGHSRIRDFIVGSTTTELIQNCRIPVLCFR